VPASGLNVSKGHFITAERGYGDDNLKTLNPSASRTEEQHDFIKA
jgi:hypothetical protein